MTPMTDQFDPGYRMLVVACKSDKRWFDLDAVRTEHQRENNNNMNRTRPNTASRNDDGAGFYTDGNPAGAPPLDYWLIDESEPLTTEGTNMGEARYIIGDVFDALATLEPNSVDLCFSSPPFMNLRSYLPADDPLKPKEIGTEADPADYLDVLLDVVEAVDRVLAPHGTLAWELGDTYSGSGGAGGDYAEDGLRDGQPMFRQVYDAARWPLPKSLCGIPTLFAWSLAYGRNLLRPERETPRWRIRNLIVWARPNPPVGALGDKFRPATSYLTVACKSDKRWFDLDAVRTEWKLTHSDGTPRDSRGPDANGESPRHPRQMKGRVGTDGENNPSASGNNPAGAPPLDYWEIPTHPFPGAHYATFPPALCIKPIESMTPKRVCRVCGLPSRRYGNAGFDLGPELAAHIEAQRTAAGLARSDLVPWFIDRYKNADSVTAQLSNWERGKNIPGVTDWVILKEGLALSSQYDELIEARDPGHIGYAADGEMLEPSERRTSYDRGGVPENGNRVEADRVAPDRWTDCNHNDWRAGCVLDPFAGSGTSLSVATGHGRDAIGIDLDARNFELARERVGPMFLPEPEFVGEPFQFPKVEVVQTDAEVL